MSRTLRPLIVFVAFTMITFNLASWASSVSASTAPADSAATSAHRASSGSPEPIMGLAFMSWNAPFGMPRAAVNLASPCGTGHPDTLWLALAPGGDSPAFSGIDVEVVVHSIAPDTLDGYWTFGGGSRNPRNIRVEFSDAVWPGPAVASGSGVGSVRYSRVSNAGTLRINYSVPADSASPVTRGQRYVIARIIFPALLDGAACRHPVCIEWRSGLLGLDGHLERVASAGERFVGWASRDGRSCDPLKPAPTPAPPETSPPHR